MRIAALENRKRESILVADNASGLDGREGARASWRAYGENAIPVVNDRGSRHVCRDICGWLLVVKNP
jgi:hypothetical protein